jgi:hypothetical protein
MTTYPNMNLVLPTRGPTGAGVWDDTIDADIAILDAHNHSNGQGVAIPTAGLNINADLSFSSLYAPSNLHRLQFSAIAGGSLTAGQRKSLFVSDGTGGLTANELYFLNSSGTAIKFTNGNLLNVGAFVGGIGGDYSSVGAALNYDDSAKRYTFKEGTADSNGWARLAAGGLRLFEFNTTESLYVEQVAPAALASSFTMTWPVALPAASQTVSIDNTGQIAFGASQALAANNSFTVSGAGDYKHGTRTLQIPAAALNPAGGVTITLNTGSVTFGITTNPAAYAPITLADGCRVTAIRVYIQDNATGPSTLTATFYSVGTTGTVTNIASSSASAGSGANQTLTIGSLTTTLAASTSYGIKIVETSGTGSTCTVYMAEVDYDR